MTVLTDARRMADHLSEIRADLHEHPEIGLDLPRTQAKVLSVLRQLPVEIRLGKGSTSVTAVLRGSASAPGEEKTVVLLRADMDALPVEEQSGWEHASRVRGVMHACGHDLHTAMLLGAAQLLADRRNRLAGDVVFMFQPGEEGWEGARTMIGEGVLDAAGKRADAAYALHVFSNLPQRMHTRPGPMLAGSAALLVTVRGKGGHASAPHLARDPIPVAAEMVLALRAMTTSQVDVFNPAVVTVGTLHAGTRRNIIPDTATFEATIRTFSDDTRDLIGHRAYRLLRGIADAHGVEADVEFVPERPVTMSDPAETRFVTDTIVDAVGEHWHQPLANPFTGAEDFSRVLAEVPGAFIALGALPVDLDPARAEFNHSGRAVFDDAVLPFGAALHTELALRRTRLPLRQSAFAASTLKDLS